LFVVEVMRIELTLTITSDFLIYHLVQLGE